MQALDLRSWCQALKHSIYKQTKSYVAYDAIPGFVMAEMRLSDVNPVYEDVLDWLTTQPGAGLSLPDLAVEHGRKFQRAA